MNRFHGCVLGVMGTGHCLAVAAAGARGTLQGSVLLLQPLGLALAVPAWLFHGAARLAAGEERWRRRVAALDLWLGAFLLALGPHNLPLAVPAFLALAYQLHGRRAVGWTIVAATIAVQAALFAGSLVFLASGRTFEEFSGM